MSVEDYDRHFNYTEEWISWLIWCYFEAQRRASECTHDIGSLWISPVGVKWLKKMEDISKDLTRLGVKVEK